MKKLNVTLEVLETKQLITVNPIVESCLGVSVQDMYAASSCSSCCCSC